MIQQSQHWYTQHIGHHLYAGQLILHTRAVWIGPMWAVNDLTIFVILFFVPFAALLHFTTIYRSLATLFHARCQPMATLWCLSIHWHVPIIQPTSVVDFVALFVQKKISLLAKVETLTIYERSRTLTGNFSEFFCVPGGKFLAWSCCKKFNVQ